MYFSQHSLLTYPLAGNNLPSQKCQISTHLPECLHSLFVYSSESKLFYLEPKAKKLASTLTWQFYLLCEYMCWHPLDNQTEEPNSQPGNLYRRNSKLKIQFQDLPCCTIFIL